MNECWMKTKKRSKEVMTDWWREMIEPLLSSNQQGAEMKCVWCVCLSNRLTKINVHACGSGDWFQISACRVMHECVQLKIDLKCRLDVFHAW